mmetsp:Transcript_3772/g.9157  ORF Transcript_3772/g.9157 Transcript_3772/m.9157 type:complete len:234 (-) Transcript_3772:1962-2663(-)
MRRTAAGAECVSPSTSSRNSAPRWLRSTKALVMAFLRPSRRAKRVMVVILRSFLRCHLASLFCSSRSSSSARVSSMSAPPVIPPNTDINPPFFFLRSRGLSSSASCTSSPMRYIPTEWPSNSLTRRTRANSTDFSARLGVIPAPPPSVTCRTSACASPSRVRRAWRLGWDSTAAHSAAAATPPGGSTSSTVTTTAGCVTTPCTYTCARGTPVDSATAAHSSSRHLARTRLVKR